MYYFERPEFSKIVSNAVSTALEKEIESIKKELQKQMPGKMQVIKSEIRNDFVQIARRVFESVFENYYDDAFDKQSLWDSLIFIDGSKMYPDIDFNKSLFKFLDEEERHKKKFNHNAFENYYKDPDMIDEFYMSNMYDDYEEESAQYQESQEGMLDDSDRIDNTLEYWNFTKTNNNRRIFAYSPLEQVYRIAKERTLQQFEKQYESNIKPKILKKYKVHLG